MFTGLVHKRGALVERRAATDRQTLVIEAAFAQADRILGASIAVSGVCLTVTASSERRVHFDAAFETLRATTLGDVKIGGAVNLEPALRVGDPLGGHLVSGHVDEVGRIRSIAARGDARQIWISVTPALAPLVAAKGSVTVDGVSLTVNEVDTEGFCVGLIPHTLSVTTLGALAVGDAVNLEADVLARYVARRLSFASPMTARGGEAGSDEDTLRDAMSAGGWEIPQ